jgi:hypothetical protein
VRICAYPRDVRPEPFDVALKGFDPTRLRGRRFGEGQGQRRSGCCFFSSFFGFFDVFQRFRAGNFLCPLFGRMIRQSRPWDDRSERDDRDEGDDGSVQKAPHRDSFARKGPVLLGQRTKIRPAAWAKRPAPDL